MVNSSLLSISSSPYWSMLSAVTATCVILVSMRPVPLTCAKSRTRRNSALAIRGVPLDLPAISAAASAVMGTPRIDAYLVIMRCSVSGW